mgnify:CR=1 FL=1
MLDVNAVTVSISPISDKQVVHLMGQVEQDGPTSGLASPSAANVEIVVGLVEQGGACDADKPSQNAAFDDLARLGHDRAVVAVVAGQHRNPGLFAGLNESGG